MRPLVGAALELRESAAAMAGDAVARLAELLMAENPSADVGLLARATDPLKALFLGTGATVVRDQGPHGDHLVVLWHPASHSPAFCGQASHGSTSRGPGDPAFRVGVNDASATGDPGAAGHVLLVGHYDTALPAGAVRERPFRLDGALTGPGVYDMKGALVQVALAMRLIREHG